LIASPNFIRISSGDFFEKKVTIIPVIRPFYPVSGSGILSSNEIASRGGSGGKSLIRPVMVVVYLPSRDCLNSGDRIMCRRVSMDIYTNMAFPEAWEGI
jgi:hypothetical protein